MAKPIIERIAAALAPDARAASVADLIAEMQARHAAEIIERDRQHAIAVSVSSDDATADTAADAETRSIRKITRISGQIAELDARLQTLLASESRRRREVHDAEIITERDQLVTDLRDRWQPLVEELASLIDRIDASEKRTKGIRGAACAEALARGCQNGFHVGVSPVMRFMEMNIPQLAAGAPLLRQADLYWAMR